ncbi:SpoIIE family protein phosphatase [Streptomyces rimosus]|uniref:SpoIIE family protein phosphatase n=1 Tax=Streptomyces rimosus TaxID=1927 RepID=UPI0005194EEB
MPAGPGGLEGAFSPRYLTTCLYAVHDPHASRLRLADAGHVPPVLVRAADGGTVIRALASAGAGKDDVARLNGIGPDLKR